MSPQCSRLISPYAIKELHIQAACRLIEKVKSSNLDVCGTITTGFKSLHGCRAALVCLACVLLFGFYILFRIGKHETPSSETSALTLEPEIHTLTNESNIEESHQSELLPEISGTTDIQEAESEHEQLPETFVPTGVSLADGAACKETEDLSQKINELTAQF
jgi:hypothetical protein